MNKLTHSDTIDLLVRYATVEIDSKGIALALNIEDSRELQETLGVFQADLDSIGIDEEEGATEAQDSELYDILHAYATDLLTF
jgi:hypothetical protein